MSADRPDRFSRNVLIELRPERYKTRLTDGWARSFADEVDDSITLKPAAYALLIELRSISISASLPYTLVSHMVGFYSGFVRGRSNDRDATRIAGALTARLCKATAEWNGDHALSSAQLLLIQSEALRIKRELDAVDEVDISEDLGNQAWDSYLEDFAFRLGIWGSQRQAFVSIYNAYDSFLTASIKAKAQLSSYRGDKKKGIREHFGPAAVEACWTQPDINLGRVVRHAISHAEGKETRDLSQLEHQIQLTGEDKVLNIFPQDVQKLLKAVEDSALFLVKL